jgi:cytochrome b561
MTSLAARPARGSLRQSARYTAVAITLHWLIALAIAAMVVMGLVMVHVKLAPFTLFRLYQLHKSIGITILLLAVLRLLWRLTHRPPPLPAEMPKLERQAAEGTHILLYGLMFGLPLVGWALVSASPLNIPTVLYGLVPWPHLPPFATLPDKKAAEAVLKLIHRYGAYGLIAVVTVHAAAALRHHLWSGDDILRRMVPGLPSLRSGRAPSPSKRSS